MLYLEKSISTFRINVKTNSRLDGVANIEFLCEYNTSAVRE